MKALLLAAGLGTRLRPLTDRTPKCLVPIAGVPLLDVWISRLAEAGVHEVVVNTHHLAPVVEAHVAAAGYPIPVRTVHEATLLGTAGTIAAHRDWMAGDDVIVAHADNYSLFDVAGLVAAHRARPVHCTMTMLAFRTATPWTCGILDVGPDGVLRAMWEKSRDDHGDLANAAVYVVGPALVDSIGGAFDLSTEVIPRHMGRILVVETDRVHIDIGTPETLAQAQAYPPPAPGATPRDRTAGPGATPRDRAAGPAAPSARPRLVRLRRQLWQLRAGGPAAWLRKVPRLGVPIDRVRGALCRDAARAARAFAEADPRLLSALRAIAAEDAAADRAALARDVDALRVERDAGRTQRARDGARALASRHPDDARMQEALAQFEFVVGNFPAYVEGYRRRAAIAGARLAAAGVDPARTRVLGIDWVGALGHLTHLDALAKLAALAAERGAGPATPHLLLVDRTRVGNAALLALLSPYVTLVEAHRALAERLHHLTDVARDPVPMLRARGGVVDQWSGIDEANWEWWHRHRRPLVEVPEHLLERGRRVTRRWGMPDGAWFVAMHVREGGHRAQASLPNADVRTYLPAIRRITDRGGWVVRMGSPLMTPLPPMPRVVDYAHAIERVDWMDVYLWSRARFFVGTQSGGSEPPKVFDTPTIRTNHSSFGHAEWGPRSFFLPKRYRLRGAGSAPGAVTGPAGRPAGPSGGVATLSESLASPVPWCESRIHEGLEFDVIDNDADDLVAAVDEMLALLDDPDRPLAPSQVRAQELRAGAGAVGRMPVSRSFLERHPEWCA